MAYVPPIAPESVTERPPAMGVPVTLSVPLRLPSEYPSEPGVNVKVSDPLDTISSGLAMAM